MHWLAPLFVRAAATYISDITIANALVGTTLCQSRCHLCHRCRHPTINDVLHLIRAVLSTADSTTVLKLCDHQSAPCHGTGRLQMMERRREFCGGRCVEATLLCSRERSRPPRFHAWMNDTCKRLVLLLVLAKRRQTMTDGPPSLIEVTRSRQSVPSSSDPPIAVA